MVKRMVRDAIPDAMWVGSVEKLERVVALGREIQAKTHAQVELALKETAAARKAEFVRRRYLTDDDDISALWRDENKREIQAAKDSIPLTLSVKLAAYGEEIKGKPEEVLSLIDAPEDVRSVTLRLGLDGYLPYGVPEHSGFRISIDKTGAAAVIFGQSREWIDMVRAPILRELRRQKPWYSWTRRLLPTVVFSNVPLTLPLTVWATAIWSSSSPYAWSGWVVYGVAVTLGLLSGMFLWPRLIPMFELVPVGVESRGRRVIGILGASSLWVMGTIFVPIVLQRIFQ